MTLSHRTAHLVIGDDATADLDDTAPIFADNNRSRAVARGAGFKTVVRVEWFAQTPDRRELQLR